MIFVKKLVLASNSITRHQLLTSAKIKFDVISPKINEKKYKDFYLNKKLSLAGMAIFLANAKCNSVSKLVKNHYVLGCDQTLVVNNEYLSKPKNVTQAKLNLLKLQGSEHCLITANVIKFNSKTLWKFKSKSYIKIRKMKNMEIENYIKMFPSYESGPYQLEVGGAHIIEKIKGNYFDILGLSLIEIIKFLRNNNINKEPC